MIPDADLDRLPSAIADKYRADPARWEAAALSTLAQRAGKAIARPHQPRCTVLASAVDEWAFVTTRTLLEDARRLLPSLIGVDLVVGVARSGLLPAGVLAYDLHRPLWSVSPSAGLLDVGHGVRLDGQAREVRRIAVVDDTTARGVAMREASAIVRERFPDAEIVRAVVYAHPHGMGEVDIVVREYPGLHYLEWNWCNAGHGVKCGFDFDGIICHDLEDGPDYVRRIIEAPPLYLPRRHPIPLIVTARPESVRAETLDWLDRHGLTCERHRDAGLGMERQRVGRCAGGPVQGRSLRPIRLADVRRVRPIPGPGHRGDHRQGRAVPRGRAGVRTSSPQRGRGASHPGPSDGDARASRGAGATATAPASSDARRVDRLPDPARSCRQCWPRPQSWHRHGVKIRQKPITHHKPEHDRSKRPEKQGRQQREEKNHPFGVPSLACSVFRSQSRQVNCSWRIPIVAS
jgi:hypoxanthine phosphoribosyltransferase